ncbi:MAG: Ig-like domain-containing protein, partial [Coprobacillus sp.]|nr:Ig-like domain-containing protein [Coprobacillus sp.]
AEGSAEGLYGDGSKNIKVSWGETYDITITFGETNSILVTVHEDSENEGEATPTLFGFEYNGLNYYADGKTTSRGDYAGSVTANIDEAVPVTCSEAEGDNAYYLTFELEGTTYYICIITLNEYENLQYLTTPTPIYWNETYGAWVNAASTHFLAYNATSGYECLWASDISTYISSSPIVGLLDYPTIEGITLSAATQSIYIGRSVTINVTYTPSTIGASNLVWESSNEEVATVTDGVVIGIAVGDVTITATTLNDLTATITLEVVAAPEDEELSIEITPESLAAEYGTDVSQHTDISGNTSTYGGGAVTVAWNKTSGSGDSTGFRPWNSVTTTNNVTTIRIYSGESFTVSSGTGSVSRVVIDAAYGSNNTNNSCGTGTSSFSATNATVGAAVTTDLGDEIEITLNSGAASTTITRSGSVCYCSGITLYYYA